MDVVAYSQSQELVRGLSLGTIILPSENTPERLCPGSQGEAYFVYIQFPLRAVIMFRCLQHNLVTCVVDVKLPLKSSVSASLCDPILVVWVGQRFYHHPPAPEMGPSFSKVVPPSPRAH